MPPPATDPSSQEMDSPANSGRFKQPEKKLQSVSRISKRSVGEFNPKNWINEGDGLMASSRKIREIWDDHRRGFSAIGKGQITKDDWDFLTGLPRASMLLLGYSVEMYLKSGLTKAYHGCSEEMFQRDIKRRFGHDFISLADEIVFPLQNDDENSLKLLHDMVLFDARYPVFVPEGATYYDAANQRTGRIWNQGNFNSFTQLASRIRTHSKSIDSTSNNPASFILVNVDEDGYVAFRVGGNLPPRLTYRLSSTQKRSGQTSVNDVKALIKEFNKSRIIMSYWDRAWIYEDDEKKTRCHRRPKS